MGTYVARRRQELGYERQSALAEAAGVSTRTISSLETGNSAKSWTLNKVEAALKWAPGSWEAVAEGSEPTTLVDTVAPPTAGEIDDAGREILDATPERLVDMFEMIDKIQGRVQARDFLVKALRLRGQTSQQGESARSAC